MYPAFLEDAERWLDGEGGARSVRGAALRAADAAGLARGSAWSPGSNAAEREGSPEADAHAPAGANKPSADADVQSAADMQSARDMQSAAAAEPESSAGADQHALAARSSTASGHGDPSVVQLESLEGRRTGATQQGGGGPDPKGATRRSSPAPRQPAAGRAWSVAVGPDGILSGCPQPAASLEIARLLASVLCDGHELSESEMMTIFRARGADFQVCRARCPVFPCSGCILGQIW